MYFEGNPLIFDHLRAKRFLVALGDAAHEEIRPVLLILGGAMRGVYGGGQAIALHKAILTEAFDTVIGISTGAALAAYLVAGQIKEGTTIYWNECATPEFFSLSRALYGKPVMDVRYLSGVFSGQHGRPRVHLDQDLLRKARTACYVGATCAETGAGHFLDAKSDHGIDALRASMAAPALTDEYVMIDHNIFVDGCGAFPLPIKALIKRFKPTDLLVLANRPRPQGRGSEFQLPFYGMLRPPARRAFETRKERFAQELQYLRTQTEVRFGIAWADTHVGAFERNPKKLESAASRAELRLTSLLTETQTAP